MLRELFQQGRYIQVLAESVDSREGTFQPEDLPFVVGALTFRGRLHEAEHLFKLRVPVQERSAPTPNVLVVACRFFLGVGLCRHALYREAREYLGANLRRAGRSKDPLARFYAWQGLGFYRLTAGRHRDGFRAAQRALEAALEASFLWGKLLASDLMAHNQVLPGQVSAALNSFRDAMRYAELLGDGGIRTAVQVSLAIHSAQHGLAPETDAAELRRLAATIPSEDNYSKSRLLLELGRQLTLRGDIDEAEAALNEACQLIYGSKHRRYGIILNLRYAHLMHLRGEQHQGLNLVRNAAKELDMEVDRSLACEVFGLEQKLLRALGLEDAANALDPQIKRLSKQTGRLVSQRIQMRAGGASCVSLQRLGDDPLGDLLDLAAASDLDAATKLVEKGFYGLLLQLIPSAVGLKALYFDLIPGGVVILDRGRVRNCSAGFSSVIRALAKVLMSGEASKQDLIEKVWGYNYQALKHDALIYRNVSRFRALLGKAASWVEVTESGYRLAEGVEVRFREHEAKAPAADAPAPAPAAPAPNVSLRQLKLLQHLATAESLDVKQAMRLFGLSEMTARRDLTQLFNLKLVQRLGKGRATRYVAV